ncbi:unnamed protein product [Zymoseptoria tritici ST99CH_1E4]|uniref:Uncharacterized protein n=1 Tax=Zymoseptoria tritici ST99CH_1E4 TaxID=1276532 RepID=A0A2H1H931_ZYMTR|nr:unnamed protein product [Zymoseptoria tritici ST99CH_1E4]
MARTTLDDLHYHYGGELEIMGSLNSTKALTCPIVVHSKNQFFPCQCALGAFRTARIANLLEDLHFHKSRMEKESDNDTIVCIARIAMLIAKNTFCSKHDPRKHQPALKTRVQSVLDKALKCPTLLFAAGGEDHDFESVAAMLQTMIPQNPQHSKKRLRGADDEDTTQPPITKRARPFHDDHAPQWSNPFVRQDSSGPPTLDATGQVRGDVLGDEAQKNNGHASLIIPNTFPGPNTPDLSPILSCTDDSWWPYITLSDDDLFPTYLSDTAAAAASPSIEKLARMTSSGLRSSSTPNNEHFESTNSPPTSYCPSQSSSQSSPPQAVDLSSRTVEETELENWYWTFSGE